MIYKLIAILYEIKDLFNSFLLGPFVRNPTKGIIQKGSYSYKKFVVVCLYDLNPRPDLRRLLSELRSSGFGIVGVVSNNADTQYIDQIDITVKIVPFGLDFLAYQQGYRALEKLGLLRNIQSLCFLNDSVWFFPRKQIEIVNSIDIILKDSALVAGAIIADEVPHCSGWLFALPINGNTLKELEELFGANFLRKSKRYNVRNGEHKILHTIVSTSGIRLVESKHEMLPYPHCYKALAEGLESFYLKHDATFRVGAVNMALEKFIKVNCDSEEGNQFLQWLSARSRAILIGKKHTIQSMNNYMRKYFGDASQHKM